MDASTNIPPLAEKEEHEAEVAVDLRFVPVAQGYVVAFLLTLLASGIATFLAVPWSADTDKIILYYGFVNPCILFDHYPAKVVAMVGMSFFILIGILYDFMVFLKAYVDKGLSATIWAGIVVWSVTLVHLSFVNVFVTDLYHRPESSSARRLHGVHHAMGGAASLIDEPLYAEEAAQGLSQDDLKTIELHTAFYIIWLLGELWMLSLLMQSRREHILKKSFCTRMAYAMFASTAIIGIALHAAAMLVIILQDKPKVEWYFREEMKGKVQWAIIYADAKLGTSTWGWIPAMIFRWVFSGGEGVRFAMSLRRREGDDGGLMPEWWVGRALQTAAFVLLSGGAFVGTWEKDTTTVFKLASPLRTKPFAYFGAPVLFASFICIGVGLFFTCVQRRLMYRQSGMPWKLVVTALLIFFSLMGCTLIVLEEERFTYIFFGCAVGCYMAWVMQLSAAENYCGALCYCVSGIVLLASAVLLNIWVLYYAFLGWLCMYNPIVPDGDWLHISVTKLEDDSWQYSLAAEGKEGTIARAAGESRSLDAALAEPGAQDGTDDNPVAADEPDDDAAAAGP